MDAVPGIDDFESERGRVEVGQAEQHGGDSGAQVAVLVPMVAGNAAPGVRGADTDGWPVAQFTRREAKLAIGNMREDWAARARPAVVMIRCTFHGGEKLGHGQSRVKAITR
jgi:hypothetical protein